MKLLVIGAHGQLAQALAERAGPQATLSFVGRPALDLADAASVAALAARDRPDAIINTAAYTAVDRAESEREAAFAVNATGVAALGDLAAAWGVPLIHVSTDYVFAGDSATPYREEDGCAPIGVYGASKLAGEQALAASGADYAIVRTAWLYGPAGQNFVRTMLRLARDRDVIRVVDDQIGSPTSALDLGDALLGMAARWPEGGVRRIYHAVNGGRASWADLATELFTLARAHGLPAAEVERIPTSAYPTPARRPAFSLLDTARIGRDFGITLRDWRTALKAMIDDPTHRAALTA